CSQLVPERYNATCRRGRPVWSVNRWALLRSRSMADHSALDREGAGSNPASGFGTANPGYAAFQLARALTTAEEHHDPAARQRAVRKAQKWKTVFEGMVAGSIAVGSRTPVSDAPAWA